MLPAVRRPGGAQRLRPHRLVIRCELPAIERSSRRCRSSRSFSPPQAKAMLAAVRRERRAAFSTPWKVVNGATSRAGTRSSERPFSARPGIHHSARRRPGTPAPGRPPATHADHRRTVPLRPVCWCAIGERIADAPSRGSLPALKRPISVGQFRSRRRGSAARARFRMAIRTMLSRSPARALRRSLSGRVPRVARLTHFRRYHLGRIERDSRVICLHPPHRAAEGRSGSISQMARAISCGRAAAAAGRGGAR